MSGRTYIVGSEGWKARPDVYKRQAKDLFGSEDHYVVSVQDLNRTDILTDAFCWVMEREEMIREHLKSVIPEVKKRAQDAAIYLNKMIQ